MHRPWLRRLWGIVHGRRWLRNSSGFILLLAGILGPVTPVFGVWMIPLGLVLLSVDFRWARRWHERLYLWAQRRHSRNRIAAAIVKPRDPRP